MEYNILKFEDIDFATLQNITYKQDRQVFKSSKEKLFYKFFKKNWEFCDMCEIGFNKGIYNQSIVKNFSYLIKDNQGNNRGYVCKEFNLKQKLYYYDSAKNIFYYILFKTKSNLFIYKNKLHFINLLKNLFSSFLECEYIYIGINKESIWHDQNGYYIFDLDAIRSKKWLFENNYEDPEFIRKKYNLEIFNRKILDLFKIHNLQVPPLIKKDEDIKIFYDYLLKL